jgi:hypothetical protein
MCGFFWNMMLIAISGTHHICIHIISIRGKNHFQKGFG